MKLIILYLFCAVSSICTAQVHFDHTVDIYGLRVEFKKILYTGQGDCCIVDDIKNRYHLMEAIVDTVYFMRDTSVYESRDSLATVLSFVVPDTLLSNLKFEQHYFCIARNTCSSKLIFISKISEGHVVLPEIASAFPYVSGLRKCYRRSFMNRTFSWLGLQAESKGRTLVKPVESIFVQQQ